MYIAVRKQISEVIFMTGNDAILMTHQINAHYNNLCTDGAIGLALSKINTN